MKRNIFDGTHQREIKSIDNVFGKFLSSNEKFYNDDIAPMGKNKKR